FRGRSSSRRCHTPRTQAQANRRHRRSLTRSLSRRKSSNSLGSWHVLHCDSVMGFALLWPAPSPQAKPRCGAARRQSGPRSAARSVLLLVPVVGSDALLASSDPLDVLLDEAVVACPV